MMTPAEIALSDRVNIICCAWRRVLKQELPKEAATAWVKHRGFQETLDACTYVFSRYKKVKTRIEKPGPYVQAILNRKAEL